MARQEPRGPIGGNERALGVEGELQRPEVQREPLGRTQSGFLVERVAHLDVELGGNLPRDDGAATTGIHEERRQRTATPWPLHRQRDRRPSSIDDQGAASRFPVAHLPRHSGVRFSVKADIPSVRSSEAKSRKKRFRS